MACDFAFKVWRDGLAKPHPPRWGWEVWQKTNHTKKVIGCGSAFDENTARRAAADGHGRCRSAAAPTSHISHGGRRSICNARTPFRLSISNDFTRRLGPPDVFIGRNRKLCCPLP